jgi:serine/threonine protein phosphatase PrpC
MNEPSSRGTLTVSFGEVCDRGKVRTENQDSILHASIHLGELFIVADGIGGYQGGATASRMVVEGFQRQLATRPPNYPPEDALVEACAYTNASIFNEAQSGNPAYQRMGSTVVLALIQSGAASGGSSGEVAGFGPVAFLGHVGDSRAYLIRNGQMTRQTNDHSAVQALLNRNLITEEEARNHPDASVLTRSLGHRPETEIEIDKVPLQPGDALLLCSDGLWGYVADADIAAVAVDPNLSVQTVANTLLQLALAAGGQDNIGIEFIRIGGNGAAPLAAVPLAAQAAPRSTASIGAPSQTAAATGPHRTQQLLAIALLLLAGCGFVGYEAFHHWPRIHSFLQRELETPSAAQSADSSQDTGSGTTPKRHKDADPGGGDTPARQTPSAAVPARRAGDKEIGIVGEIQLGRYVPPSPDEIEWQRAVIKRESRPSCVRLANDATQVFASKADLQSHAVLDAIAERYPDASVDGHDFEGREITPALKTACGEEYDAVVILAVQKPSSPPSATSAPTVPPVGPGSTDSQEHSLPVQQHPRRSQQ